jgi:hypothetical protein
MYEPRAGSHGARAIEHLQQAGADAELTSAELAAALGLDEALLCPSLTTIRKHGLVVAERQGGRGLVWSLPQPEEEAEPAAFSAALWTDGELVIYGAQANEGGKLHAFSRPGRRGPAADHAGRVAGDWIKMRANLRRHPKVVRVASALNADRLRVVGGLHAVWCLFDEHSEDGHLSGYTPSAVDDEIGWPASPRP